jgi:hypothetical protein
MPQATAISSGTMQIRLQRRTRHSRPGDLQVFEISTKRPPTRPATIPEAPTPMADGATKAVIAVAAIMELANRSRTRSLPSHASSRIPGSVSATTFRTR